MAAAFTPGDDARTLWRRLGGASVLRSLFPTEDPVDPSRLDDLLVELDSRMPLGTVLSVCVQVASVIPLLRIVAPDSAYAREVLEQMLDGSAIVALAVTERGLSGAALLEASTEIADMGDHVTLNGEKEWICNAGRCDYVLALARHRPARHFTSFSWVLLRADTPGVSWQPATTLFPGAALGHFRFADVRLERQHVIGRQGRALAEFALQIGTERLAGALWARALCRRVLADTRHYLAGRSTGAATLWHNAAIRERFARCLVEFLQLDALCAIHGTHADDAATAMLLKAACAQSAEHILCECVDLRGADAFRDDGVASVREQAAMFGIAGGATGAMLAGLADHADELLEPR